MVMTGEIKIGESVRVQPSNQETRLARIVTFDGDLERAVAGQCVTLVLEKSVDVGRGHLICGISDDARCADFLEAIVVCTGESSLLVGRWYHLKLGAKVVHAQIAEFKHKSEMNNFAIAGTRSLAMNEIGLCTLNLRELLAYDLYEQNRDTGGFILIDLVTNDTVGVGFIRAGDLKADDVPWQRVETTKGSRSSLKNQPPGIIWFTGISGAGKSTIANLVEKMLHVQGRHTYLLDGDNIRHGLNSDLGFSDADRVENVRRVAEVAKLMADAGLLVLVALISPFRAERRAAREMVPAGEFVEIFVDTPLEVAEARDVKGLYEKARHGDLPKFTGIDSPYETPEGPEVHIRTTNMTAEEAAKTVLRYLEANLLRDCSSRETVREVPVQRSAT
jgi:bifunctional enzyme CysN/CysC